MAIVSEAPLEGDISVASCDREVRINEDRGPKTHQNPRLGSSLMRA